MCRKNVLTIVAVAILPLAIGQVQAVTVPVPIDNPGFEDSVLPDGEYDYSLDNQGWGYFANGGEQGSWNPGLPGTSEPGFGGNAPEGQNIGWVNPGGVGVPGGLAQVLTDADATLQADTTYTLTVEVGNTPGYPWNGYKVQLLAGGTPHTPGTGAYTGPVTGGTLLAEDNNSLTIAVDTFETSTVTYTYDPELHSDLLGEPLQIRLLSLGNVAAGDYTEVNFDNVKLSYDGPPRPPLAKNPTPADGAQIDDAWVFLSWTAAAAAVEHDVYFGDDFDEVNDATSEPPVDPYKGRQTDTFYQGYDLVPGTTYYWRIDEVNDADPNSPWKGKVWSFMVPPKTAYSPNPADGAEFIDLDVELSWTAGLGAKLHTVYFGDNFDDVNSAAGGAPQGPATYSPGPLELEKVYYWRVDEYDAVDTYKGDVWSFTTPGAVGSPNPSNGATGVKMTDTLSWAPADSAASHQVYFGTDEEAVRNATTASPEYKGARALGSESYDPGKLAWLTTYYWRIDEVNNLHPDSPWKGPLWSFTTADFIVVDDFESYNDLDPNDPESNRIFLTWMDGYEQPTNGSLVGYDVPPFCEQSIVHGGRQSMPLFYDNSGPANYSEATLPLTYPRDWTEEGVGVLTLWFYGDPANAAESMYVAVANATGPTATVYHDKPRAALINIWTEWRIDLQEFAAKGVNLANVNTISIGFGDKSSLQAGGSGMVLFDDIRLYRPTP